MHIRTVKAKGADGVELEYIRLVEAYWEKGLTVNSQLRFSQFKIALLASRSVAA